MSYGEEVEIIETLAATRRPNGSDYANRQDIRIAILELKHDIKSYIDEKVFQLNEKIHKIDMHIKLGYFLFVGVFSVLGYMISLIFKILEK